MAYLFKPSICVYTITILPELEFIAGDQEDNENFSFAESVTHVILIEDN